MKIPFLKGAELQMYEPLQKEVDVHEYYPDTLKDILEFNEISKVENANFSKVRLNILEIFSMRFVHEANEVGIARWEKMLKIKRRSSDDLEIRRMRILSKINNKLPYTWRTLHQLMTSFYGEDNYALNLDPQDFEIEILIPTGTQTFNELINILEPMLPMNIKYELAEGLLDEFIQIIAGTYSWTPNYKITGNFKTASKSGAIGNETITITENIYDFPYRSRICGRFRAGGGSV